MEELEDEPDLLAAKLRQGILVQTRDVDAVDEYGSRGWRVQSGDEAEQRGFAAARGTDDGDELPARNLRSAVNG
jgi:hypothetical protein